MSWEWSGGPCTEICPIQKFSVFLLFFSEAEPLELILYHQHQIEAALDALDVTGGEYTRVLEVGRYIPQEEQQQEPEQQQAPEQEQPNQVFTMAQNSKNMVEGKAPPEYAGQASYSTFMNEVLGLPTQRSLSRLSDYVHKVGVMKLVPVNQMGSCMFAAVRHLIDTPAEYTKTHLQ